ncbi:hypothetical protein PENTCL1PPCAC_8594, partial [Pristionchus entomophagus]
ESLIEEVEERDKENRETSQRQTSRSMSTHISKLRIVNEVYASYLEEEDAWEQLRPLQSIMVSILVTGANRGIGLGLVRQLVQEPSVTTVIATARN